MQDQTTAEAPGSRVAALPRGATLVVRPVTRHDIDDLDALYAGLDEEARYRRFFSIYRPDRRFFVRLSRVGERGGAGLVAVVIDDPGRAGRLVGEASYELLPNGSGELAITVDQHWRGWLGPYLLDALIEVAAARGVENIEADVLMTNRPMLALIRARGHVLLPTDDWTFLRARFGTGTEMPTWPGSHDRMRVLVEGTSRWRRADDAEAAGISVTACAGPCRNDRCPALHDRECPLVSGADVVVLVHATDEEPWRRLREAHAELHPSTPVIG
jgi:hypothetical protein